MDRRCPFDLTTNAFRGTPLQQARGLLRFVKRQGHVEDAPATLPAVLETLLATPDTLGVTVAQVRAYLQAHHIPEASTGGSLDDAVSRAGGPGGRKAMYFVIHDTSTPLQTGQTFDPNFINTTQWTGNRLASVAAGRTHIYINRLGETRVDKDYGTPWRATQFELAPHETIPTATPSSTVFRGLCLHHELIQPRKIVGGSDADAPEPGFTQVQIERLALQYIVASVRRGSWMIPAFHGVIDLEVGDHDDPQHFDLPAWGAALASILAAVRGSAPGTPPPPPPPPPRLRSALLGADPVLADVAAGNRVLGVSQVRMLVGVGPLQDGLNALADHGQNGLRIAGAQGPNSSRGFYGAQTVAAVRAFQLLNHLTPVDGQAGKDTVLMLDAALLALEPAADALALAMSAPGATDTLSTEEEETLETLNEAPGGPSLAPENLGPLKGTYITPAADSQTKDKKGASHTDGMRGKIYEPSPGVTVMVGEEVVTAKRDKKSLTPSPRVLNQKRVTQANGTMLQTTVTQDNYCWKTRVLPGAELFTNHTGFTQAQALKHGEASYFGKFDPVDEGTGSPAFGTTHNNSDVFGVAIPRQTLLDEGLAVIKSGILTATAKGLAARVEIYYPAKKRLVRVPIVDMGPGDTDPPRITDLTVAAACFLLDEADTSKAKGYHLPNLQVRLRIVT